MQLILSRVLGLAFVIIGFLYLDPRDSTPTHTLVLPLLLGAGALLITRSPLAVALTGFLLTATNLNFNAQEWVTRWAYPAIGIICLVVICKVGLARLRRRISATHTHRWQTRQQKKP